MDNGSPFGIPFPTVTWEREQAAKAQLSSDHVERLTQQLDILQENMSYLQTQLTLAVDERGWTKVGLDATGNDFTPEFVKQSRDFARVMYIQNPMVRRSVEVQKLYVWALGFKVEFKSPAMELVIGAFMEDPKNDVELSSIALMDKEVNLQCNGTCFSCTLSIV
jgi:hypothetical protein